MRILFWNTYKNTNINSILRDLIIEENISIVALAEYCADQNELITMLSDCDVLLTPYITVGCKRINVFGTITNVTPGTQSRYSSIQIVNNRDILCFVHLPSQLHADQAQRGIAVEAIVGEIETLEKKLKSNNTMIIGDFNANPFDPECLDARFFHGIPTAEEAMRKQRVVMGKTYNMFYNPMWNFLGDFEYPPGTYYYTSNKTCNPYWSIFDQVILRPHIKNRFVEKALKILTSTSNISLVDDRGHPDKEISDHLPIVFEIKEG